MTPHPAPGRQLHNRKSALRDRAYEQGITGCQHSKQPHIPKPPSAIPQPGQSTETRNYGPAAHQHGEIELPLVEFCYLRRGQRRQFFPPTRMPAKGTAAGPSAWRSGIGNGTWTGNLKIITSQLASGTLHAGLPQGSRAHRVRRRRPALRGPAAARRAGRPDAGAAGRRLRAGGRALRRGGLRSGGGLLRGHPRSRCVPVRDSAERPLPARPPREGGREVRRDVVPGHVLHGPLPRAPRAAAPPHGLLGPRPRLGARRLPGPAQPLQARRRVRLRRGRRLRALRQPGRPGTSPTRGPCDMGHVARFLASRTNSALPRADGRGLSALLPGARPPCCCCPTSVRTPPRWTPCTPGDTSGCSTRTARACPTTATASTRSRAGRRVLIRGAAQQYAVLRGEVGAVLAQLASGEFAMLSEAELVQQLSSE
uniref:Uncharacterized protein n=1 Tax=Spironucleus salmonicida TaxID=348837 RepID=V6LWQ9_9EUKA|eukprot:EST48151.1 Hypothetical protein SS50377_11712 [Spironucleus salmonicida]